MSKLRIIPEPVRCAAVLCHWFDIYYRMCNGIVESRHFVVVGWHCVTLCSIVLCQTIERNMTREEAITGICKYQGQYAEL